MGARVEHAPTFENVFTRDTARDDKPTFKPKFCENQNDTQNIEISDLHETFTHRIVAHFGCGKLNTEQLQKASNAILEKASNIAELHTLLSEFQKKHE